MVAARVLVLTVCFAFAALSQTAHLQPAPEVKLPILSDSSSPAHWVGGTFYLFQSGELATPDTMRAPLRFQGTDFAHLGAQIPSSIPGAPMSVWIESTWLDTNGRLYAW